MFQYLYLAGAMSYTIDCFSFFIFKKILCEGGHSILNVNGTFFSIILVPKSFKKKKKNKNRKKTAGKKLNSNQVVMDT